MPLKRTLLLLAVLLAAASAYLFVWAPFASPEPRRADAIVVLAGSKTRLPVALDLFHRGLARNLVVSEDPNDKARTRFCRLPPLGTVCFTPRPYSTRGEARAVARLAHRRGWNSLAIVTSRFHLFRTRMIFRRCTDARLELVPAPVTWWRWPEAVATEWLKLGVALTARRGC